MTRRRPPRAPSPDAIRLFVAAHVPTRVQVALGTQMVALAQSRADVRWARSEQMHVTLKFLGDTEPGRVDAICEALARVPGEPFEIGVKGLGRFPEKGPPRIVWAGVDGDVDALVELAERIETALLAADVPREGRAYNPHLTLGRVKSTRGADALDAKLAERSDGLALAPFRVEGFSLFRSELNPSGAVYTSLADFPLGRSAEAGGDSGGTAG